MMGIDSVLNTRDYQPHYSFLIEKTNFIIKIAESYSEIEQAQRLRNKVFSKVSQGFESKDIDSDDYDQNADHLIVIDKTLQQVVGTYRFLLSDKVLKHYSAREFDLTDFLKLPGRKMELGRASVDPNARAGVIITLLWRGIAEYLKITNSDYMFGCSSMWNLTSHDVFRLCEVFKRKNLMSEINVLPLDSHKPKFNPELIQTHSEFDDEIIYDLIPTLVKTYIHVGSKFTIPPAYDSKLGTYEFFGYVETKNIDPAFRKKYL